MIYRAIVPDKSGNSPIGFGKDPHLIPPLRTK